jgi:hypothetical protein
MTTTEPVHYCETTDSSDAELRLACTSSAIPARDDVRLSAQHRSLEVFKARDGRCYTFAVEEVTCPECVNKLGDHARFD